MKICWQLPFPLKIYDKHLHNIISKTSVFDTLFFCWEVEKFDYQAFKNYSTNSLLCEEIDNDGSYGI